jgi:hypothetical protein
MLVTHIFYNASDWEQNIVNNNPSAMGVDIVEADGIALTETNSIDSTLSGDPFPGTKNVTFYNPLLRDGTDIHKPLSDIREINGIIQFHFASNIILTQNLQPFSTVQGTPSAFQTVTVSGNKIKDSINVKFNTGLHFEMKKDSDPASAWRKSITLMAVDSIVPTTTIQIRYNPTVPSYSSVQTDDIEFVTVNGDYADAQLSGTSTRAVYVVPPVANEATDVTFTSFLASWNSVYDAVGYYLTVYNISDEASSMTEGFDNGLVAPVDWTITTKNTSTSTIYSGVSAPSLLFANSGEFVETETYILPVTQLSFFIRSLGGSNGGFLVEAQNDQNNWEKVDSIPVTSALYEKSKSYTFSETKGYNRLRFTYFKGIGSVTFDDVTVDFTKKLNFNLHNSWLTTTSDTISNLVPTTTYSYMVKASDKSIYYENITAFSNVISANTLSYPTKNKLVATKDGNNNITVYLPSVASTLYVYNILGQCVRTVEPDKTTIVISGLQRNQVYILKSNNLVTKIAL